jgi:hypothetical protein
MLNRLFDPEELYEGPSSGERYDAVVADAAEFLGGKAALPLRREYPERVY